jgi:8-oxo-dGTP diphosphatase
MTPPSSFEVHAAGGVVYRTSGGGIEIAVIHRPRYDDWSLPKGKLDAGESFEEAAVREIAEEIGVTAELGEELPPITYDDNKGRSKIVRYWLVKAQEAPDFIPNDEVDELRWLTPEPAMDALSYDRDRDVLAAALRRMP